MEFRVPSMYTEQLAVALKLSVSLNVNVILELLEFVLLAGLTKFTVGAAMSVKLNCQVSEVVLTRESLQVTFQ